MTKFELSYLKQRIADEIRLAERARHPRAVQAHLGLALLYSERIEHGVAEVKRRLLDARVKIARQIH